MPRIDLEHIVDAEGAPCIGQRSDLIGEATRLGGEITGDDAAGRYARENARRKIGMAGGHVTEEANLICGAGASAAEHEGKRGLGHAPQRLSKLVKVL